MHHCVLQVFGWLPPNANYSLVVWILPTATHNQTRPIAQMGLRIWHQDIVHITGGHLVDVKLLCHQWQPVASDVEVGCLWQLCAEGPHAFCCMSYLSCLFKHSPSGILMLWIIGHLGLYRYHSRGVCLSCYLLRVEPAVHSANIIPFFVLNFKLTLPTVIMGSL